jgi:hypothetical protein
VKAHRHWQLLLPPKRGLPNLSFGQTIPVSGVESTVTGNHPDLSLSFASRITTIANDTITTVACDATSLARGPALICSH